jgi:hypothetical protein
MMGVYIKGIKTPAKDAPCMILAGQNGGQDE